MSAIQTTSVAVSELREMLERLDPVTLLDIRPAADWEEWHIPGSLNVDVYQALKDGDRTALADIDLDPSTPVVTLCGVGKVSQVATEQLRARGFDARSLAGGMKAWSLAWNTADMLVPGRSARVVQLRRTGKGCLSYVIHLGREAVVIDASLEPEVYLELAAGRGWEITHVLDTHVHADHISRSRALAESSGARLHLPETQRVAYPFAPLRDGDVIDIGASRLRMIATPGHTDESASFILDERALFTGDTLFLAGVGRPDLEASTEESRERARMLWASLHRLMALPPETLVLPGHTSSPVPFDGAAIVGSLEDVTTRVAALQLSESEFVDTVLSRLPPTPPNHSSIVALNEAGAFPDGDPTDLEAGANRCAIS